MASLNAPAAVDHLPGMLRRITVFRNPSEVEARATTCLRVFPRAHRSGECPSAGTAAARQWMANPDIRFPAVTSAR